MDSLRNLIRKKPFGNYFQNNGHQGYHPISFRNGFLGAENETEHVGPAFEQSRIGYVYSGNMSLKVGTVWALTKFRDPLTQEAIT
jgi:hypothetical protein